MCTAASFLNENTYFGRTLDYEFSYGEKITITPRNYPFKFRHLGLNKNHYAIIGMAHIDNEYPMYYDAMNECGLAMAGLNFVGNAWYNDKLDENKNNVAQFEIISYILSNAKSVVEAKELLNKINIVDTCYNEFFKPASLHWIIRDNKECIVLESMKDGMHIYENKTGALTNNPPFIYQMANLKNYINLSNDNPNILFSYEENPMYSRGMGGIGLPGDLSSQSRFVRASFTSYFSTSNSDEVSSVNQFFHILESVWQTRGLCKVNDKFEITIYASCMNLDKCIYYYKTYDNSTVNGIDMMVENLDGSNLITYDLLIGKLNIQNKA